MHCVGNDTVRKLKMQTCIIFNMAISSDLHCADNSTDWQVALLLQLCEPLPIIIMTKLVNAYVFQHMCKVCVAQVISRQASLF